MDYEEDDAPVPAGGLASAAIPAAGAPQTNPSLLSPTVPSMLSPYHQRRLRKLVGELQMKKAANMVRQQASIAPITDAVVDELRRKHPAGPLHPFGPATGNVPPVLSREVIGSKLDILVQRLDSQSSPGISGWSPNLVKKAYRTKSFKRFLIDLTIQMWAGTAKGARMLCASRLTPLQQGDKIRPIACGELFYRMLTRLLLQMVQVSEYLLPNQLGIGTIGGIEPMVETLQREVETETDVERYAYLLDFSNAFNNASRVCAATALRDSACPLYRLAKWSYNEPSPLVLGGQGQQPLVVLESTEGFRQGDPLSPFLFSLVLKPFLSQLQQETSDRSLAYLDDVMVVSQDPNRMHRIEEIFAAPLGMDRPTHGLILNVRKTRCVPISTVRSSDTGLCAFGTIFGPEVARRRFLMEKVSAIKTSVARLHQLPAQQGMALARTCFVPEINHLLRTMDCSGLDGVLHELDEAFFGYVDHLRGVDASRCQRDAKVQRIYSFPLSMGGLGLFSSREIRPAARAACRATATYVLGVLAGDTDGFVNLAPPRQKERTGEIFGAAREQWLSTLSMDERVVFLDQATRCGSAWIHAQPRFGSTHRALSDRQMAAALNLRVLVPPGSSPACALCGGPNTIGHIESCPRRGTQVVWRHDQVRDLVISGLRASGRMATAEPSISSTTARRADIRVGAATGGTAVDAEFGYLDLKIKSLMAADTRALRDEASSATGQAPPDPDATDAAPSPTIARQTWTVINDALQRTTNEAARSYGPGAARVSVTPLVISSGGTLHRTFFQLLKTRISGSVRPRVLTDISITLLQARIAGYLAALPLEEVLEEPLA